MAIIKIDSHLKPNCSFMVLIKVVIKINFSCFDIIG